MQNELLPLVLQQQQENDEEDEDKLRLLLLATLVSGLLPNPRIESPWIRLWKGQENRAFITTMGFDVATFHFMLEGPGHFADVWNSTPIPRNDVSLSSVPRVERRSLDAAGELGLALHYLGSAIHEIQLQQIFAIIPSVLSRYLSFSLHILLSTLRKMREAQIVLPSSIHEFEELSSMITACHSLLEGAFGSIDGLSLVAEVSDDPELENATYNGWKTDHQINNVLMFSPKGPISIKGKIVAPMKGGERIPADPQAQALVMSKNRQLLSFRSFGRLRVPLDINCKSERMRLLELCCRLFNVCLCCVGINQIRSVYLPIWRASEDERLWDALGDMMFGEIWCKDRVSRFHVLPIQ
ncbi:MAG: hypothetical protein NXY57DRAFT_1051627 [Lentinula lateritia]|nr:MAG: hypothetical protein NXY57DRAFT_1051627 [Lentinula lateritia]